ncbi:MAG: FtsK/SpoIIIE domain-containing protein [Candidatus Paceibacterota bacterium]|jgi:hypothetical protein
MKMDKIYDKVMDYLWKALVYIVKNLFKFTFNQVLSTFKTTLRFKKILNTRTKQMIYCLTVIITCLLIWVYKLHPVLYFLSAFTFFSFYSLVQDLRNHREKARIKLLNNKYKKLREMYDNKIDVLSVKKDMVTIFSSELTEKDISSKHSRLELFFNRKISEIRQQENNLRIYKIIFLVSSKFKDKYLFDEYINYVNPSTVKKMELPFILGVDEKENIYLEDLTKLCHMFVSGESNTGKSCFLNQFIQSLMVFRNNVIQFYLVDLKEGIEMSDYLGFKNCLIVSNTKELIQIITHLENEMIKRLNTIKNTAKCKNILQYNKNTSAKQKMNYIIFLVDEFATIKLNGDTKEVEMKLLSILQKGRAAGIYCIGATQRPSGNQLNTDVRAGFLYNISLRVKTKETQRMTKILGTELLKVGEFKSDIVNKPLKTLFIDEFTNNTVFEDLEFNLIHGKEFIQIKEKEFSQLGFYKRLCNYVDSKLYKGYPVSYRSGINYLQLIKPPTPDIITEIEAIKELYEIDKNTPHMDILEKTDNYKKYTDYILVNSKENGLLPSSKNIEVDLQINKHERLKLQNRACEEGIIEKAAKTRFKLIRGGIRNNE